MKTTLTEIHPRYIGFPPTFPRPDRTALRSISSSWLPKSRCSFTRDYVRRLIASLAQSSKSCRSHDCVGSALAIMKQTNAEQ